MAATVLGVSVLVVCRYLPYITIHCFPHAFSPFLLQQSARFSAFLSTSIQMLPVRAMVCAVLLLFCPLVLGDSISTDWINNSSLPVHSKVVELATAAPNCYTSYGPFGGGGGSDWTDLAATSGAPCGAVYPTSVQTQSGDYLDRITTVYAPSGQTFSHGGGGGQFQYISLNAGEFISNVTIKYGKYVDSLLLLTTEGRKLFSGGTGGGSTWVSNFGPKEYVSFWFGRAEKFIDALGVTTFTVPTSVSELDV